MTKQNIKITKTRRNIQSVYWQHLENRMNQINKKYIKNLESLSKELYVAFQQYPSDFQGHLDR